MRTRGVLAAEALSTPQIGELSRPAAPPDLTDEQAEYWDAAVNRMPGGHFTPEALPILAQLCRHVASSRVVGKELSRLKRLGTEEELERYERVARLQHDETKAILNLSTKLRLTPASRHASTRSGLQRIRSEPAEKPWQVDKAAD